MRLTLPPGGALENKELAMKPPRKTSRDLEQLTPLLRAIQDEIFDRRQRVQRLRERLLAFASTRRAHAEEVARIEADLATHRRELRYVERELRRLGIAFDPEEPRTIIALRAPRERSGSLGETGFRSQLLDTRS